MWAPLATRSVDVSAPHLDGRLAEGPRTCGDGWRRLWPPPSTCSHRDSGDHVISTRRDVLEFEGSAVRVQGNSAASKIQTEQPLGVRRHKHHASQSGLPLWTGCRTRRNGTRHASRNFHTDCRPQLDVNTRQIVARAQRNSRRSRLVRGVRIERRDLDFLRSGTGIPSRSEKSQRPRTRGNVVLPRGQ